MKAFVLHELGGVENFKLEDMPKPTPAADEVLIAVKATSMNPVDYVIRQGYAFREGLNFPIILGCDVAGVVEAVGSDVTDFKPGDRVSGLINFPRKSGTRDSGGFAEFVTAPAVELAHVPEKVSFEEAAALSAVGLTAAQALETANVQASQRVLVHGASGGVGHIAVQLAKNAGAYVVATASGKHADFVHELGADQVVDYKTQQFETETSDIDVVLNTVGDEIAQRSLQVMKSGGTVVSLLPPSDETQARAAEKDITSVFMGVRPNGAQLEGLLQTVADGKLRVHIGASYPFAELPEAQTSLQSGGTPGKIVVTL